MSLQGVVASPWDDAAERSVLAGLMRWDAMPAYLVAKGVTVDDLWDHRHRVVWGVLWELIGCGMERHPADVLIVLRGSGLVVECGGTRATACWLADVWCEYRGVTESARAVARVLWMAERRADIRRANEVIADAVAGRIGPANYRALVRRPAKTM